MLRKNTTNLRSSKYIFDSIGNFRSYSITRNKCYLSGLEKDYNFKWLLNMLTAISVHSSLNLLEAVSSVKVSSQQFLLFMVLC